MYKHKKIKPQSNKNQNQNQNPHFQPHQQNTKRKTNKTHMEFNLRNNKYSTEFKNKPKFESISHKLFSNEELKKDSDFIKFGLQKRDRKTSS